MTKPILISGAGLAGLLLAQSLRRNNIAFELYERDASVDVRGQGYRIRISADGLNALKAVLTPDEMEELDTGTADAGAHDIHPLDGVTGEATTMGQPGKGSGRPGGMAKMGDVLGIARGFLRSELLKGLEDRIKWNKHVTGYIESNGDDGGSNGGGSGVFALFADGSKSPEGSMLVGADGVHSGVTGQLTGGNVKTYDTGARLIHGQAPSTAFKQLGAGLTAVSDSTTQPDKKLGFIANVRPGSLDDPNEELGFIFVGSPGTFDAPGGNFSVTGKVAADLLRNLTSKWHPKFHPIFEKQIDAEAAFLKMLTSDPDGVPQWENSARVTIIGDAAHCMTPAGGVGANTALKDAEILGRLIADGHGWKEGITEKFERDMRAYASVNVKMSYDEAVDRFGAGKVK